MSYLSPLCSSDLRSPAMANRNSMSGTRLMHTAIFKPALPMEVQIRPAELAAKLVAHRVGCQTDRRPARAGRPRRVSYTGRRADPAPSARSRRRSTPDLGVQPSSKADGAWRDGGNVRRRVWRGGRGIEPGAIRAGASRPWRRPPGSGPPGRGRPARTRGPTASASAPTTPIEQRVDERRRDAELAHGHHDGERPHRDPGDGGQHSGLEARPRPRSRARAGRARWRRGRRPPAPRAPRSGWAARAGAAAARRRPRAAPAVSNATTSVISRTNHLTTLAMTHARVLAHAHVLDEVRRARASGQIVEPDGAQQGDDAARDERRDQPADDEDDGERRCRRGMADRKVFERAGQRSPEGLPHGRCLHGCLRRW